MTTEYSHFIDKYKGFTIDKNLASLTWLRMGGPAKLFYRPKSLEDLQNFLKEKPKHWKIFPFGVGSNLLIRDGGIADDTLIIKLSSAFSYINDEDDVLKVGASMSMPMLAEYACNQGLDKFLYIAGIPGTVGAGAYMNAGAYGVEHKDIVKNVIAVDQDGELHTLSLEDMGYTYRHSQLPENWIIVEVQYNKIKAEIPAVELIKKRDEILQSRSDSQPVRSRTGGSTFKNPDGHSAWKLIDSVGGRGYRINDIGFSDMHCNFLINHGQATAADTEQLVHEIQEKVKEKHNINLEMEIKVIGQP